MPQMDPSDLTCTNLFIKNKRGASSSLYTWLFKSKMASAVPIPEQKTLAENLRITYSESSESSVHYMFINHLL